MLHAKWYLMNSRAVIFVLQVDFLSNHCRLCEAKSYLLIGVIREGRHRWYGHVATAIHQHRLKGILNKNTFWSANVLVNYTYLLRNTSFTPMETAWWYLNLIFKRNFGDFKIWGKNGSEEKTEQIVYFLSKLKEEIELTTIASSAMYVSVAGYYWKCLHVLFHQLEWFFNDKLFPAELYLQFLDYIYLLPFPYWWVQRGGIFSGPRLRAHWETENKLHFL